MGLAYESEEELKEYFQSVYPEGAKCFEEYLIYPSETTLFFTKRDEEVYMRIVGNPKGYIGIAIELIKDAPFVEIIDKKNMLICGIPFEIVNYDWSGVVVIQMAVRWVY